jgi:hypothetical protein
MNLQMEFEILCRLTPKAIRLLMAWDDGRYENLVSYWFAKINIMKYLPFHDFSAALANLSIVRKAICRSLNKSLYFLLFYNLGGLDRLASITAVLPSKLGLRQI